MYNEILNLPQNATEEEIKKQYKKLAKKYHPDRNTHLSKEEQKINEEKFKEITEAYHSALDNSNNFFTDFIMPMLFQNKKDNLFFNLYEKMNEKPKEVTIQLYFNEKSFINKETKKINIKYQNQILNFRVSLNKNNFSPTLIKQMKGKVIDKLKLSYENVIINILIYSK